MQSNPVWVAPLLWLAAAGTAVGGTYWGYRTVQQYREESDQELAQAQQEALSARQEQEARTRQMFAQLNPFFIAGTVVMTGLGGFVMLRGMKRERSRRYREIAEAYRGF